MTEPFYTKGSVDALVNILRSAPIGQLISNLKATPLKFPLSGNDLPATLSNRADHPNCYICDPTTAYIDYAIAETRLLTRSKALQLGISGLIQIVAPIVKASGLNHQVQLNNWLFSTNPVPLISENAAIELRDLAKIYPDRAIVLRSLNTTSDKASIAALQSAGFALLPARQIYIDCGSTVTKDMKSDCKVLSQTQYSLVDNDGFGPQDYEDCASLYRQLYLEKYPSLNPQYSATLIRLLHEAGIIHMQALRANSGNLVAFGGTFCGGNILTQPLLGYDTNLPQSDGLYRIVTSLAQSKARSRRLVFNMSAGVGGFKRLRGASPAIEYTAVYVDHLPRRQKAAVGVMQAVLSKIGVPLLERYGL